MRVAPITCARHSNITKENKMPNENWFTKRLSAAILPVPPRTTSQQDKKSSSTMAGAHPLQSKKERGLYQGEKVKVGPDAGRPRSNACFNDGVTLKVDPRFAILGEKNSTAYCQDIAVAGAAQPKFDDLVAQRSETLRDFFNRDEASPRLIATVMQELIRLPRQLVDNVGFGRWMGDIVDSNLKNNRPDVAAVIGLSTHALRVSFLQKPRNDGKVETAILFSDPNGNPDGTGKAKRLVVESGAECAKYTAAECFARLFEYGWKEDNHSTLSFTAFCPDVPLADPAKMAYIQEALNPAGKNFEQMFAARRHLLAAAIRDSHPEVLHKVCDDLQREGIEGKVAARDYLRADTLYNISSVAYMVKENPEMLEHLAACALKLGVKGKNAGFFLLKDLYDAALPALHRVNSECTDDDTADRVKRLGEFMSRCEVKGEIALKVLESRHNHDSLLSAAAKKNRPITVKALLAESTRHGFTDAQRRQFLEARFQGELDRSRWGPKTVLDHTRRLGLTEVHDLIKAELDTLPAQP